MDIKEIIESRLENARKELMFWEGSVQALIAIKAEIEIAVEIAVGSPFTKSKGDAEFFGFGIPERQAENQEKANQEMNRIMDRVRAGKVGKKARHKRPKPKGKGKTVVKRRKTK